jgi:hypothetical protein
MNFTRKLAKVRYLPTKKQYEDHLNEFDVPHHDCKSCGGRIPDNALYGSWLRRNDPIAFITGYQEYINGIRRK